MADVVDAAFDVFVSSRLVSWINGRIGDGQSSPDGLNGPQLDCEVVPGVIVDSRGRWFRPEFGTVSHDAAFNFAARQTTEVDEDGDPFNRATLTLTLAANPPTSLPADGAATTPVPDLDLAVNLTVPTVAADGTTVTNRVHGAVVANPDSNTFNATFELKGAEVIATYVHLTQRDPQVPGGVVFQFIASHAAVQPASFWPARIELPVAVPGGDFAIDLPGQSFNGIQFKLVGPEGQAFGTIPEFPSPFGQIPTSVRFLPIIARYDRALELGQTFHTDEYRARFTITRDGMTRPIIDANDLSEFAGPRSEYRELTSLGTVSAKYPSLRRLYFGQVSGTVVAVPATYGIQRTSKGLAASCDAIVDAGSITGSRFHFTFQVAPMADPVDLTQLAADVAGIPEAAGRTLHVSLPAGLDSRNPSTLDGFPAARTDFADSSGTAVQVSVDIADDQAIPSTALVNQFLNQLGAGTPAPLFGNLAVRLDDLFAQPVNTTLTLNLHQTADGDELTAAPAAGGSSEVEITNDGPFGLTLHRLSILNGTTMTVSDLGGQPLASGQALAVPGNATAATALAVSRRLPVPSPVPKADMLTYVDVNTTAVDQIQHSLNVNATAVNFAAGGIAAIEVQFTLTAHPTIAVPALTLSSQHAVDFVHVLIPVVAALAGLQTTVVLAITTTGEPRDVTLTHDFINQPILVLTDAVIA